jgi:hypothetical protein
LNNYSEEYSIWTAPPYTGSGSSGYYCVFYEVFIAEEVNGARRGIRRYHYSCTNSLGGAFLNMSLRYVCFFDENFSGNKCNF